MTPDQMGHGRGEIQPGKQPGSNSGNGSNGNNNDDSGNNRNNRNDGNDNFSETR